MIIQRGFDFTVCLIEIGMYDDDNNKLDERDRRKTDSVILPHLRRGPPSTT